MRPAKGLNPNLEKATAGRIKIRNGMRRRNMRKIARDMGRKYMNSPL